MRTFESLYNFFSPDNLGREASSTEYRKLYNSIAEGKYQKQYDKLIKKGYTAQQLENGVKNNLVKSEPRIAQAAQARERGNISEYKKIYEEKIAANFNVQEPGASLKEWADLTRKSVSLAADFARFDYHYGVIRSAVKNLELEISDQLNTKLKPFYK